MRASACDASSGELDDMFNTYEVRMAGFGHNESSIDVVYLQENEARRQNQLPSFLQAPP